MEKISLVLSGGGARGIAHIGVIEELEKQGYEIHSITGTSMGAVVGGIYANGKIEEFKKWLLELDKVDVFKLVDFTLFDSGFIKGDRMFEELSTFIKDTQIEDLPITFSATATDLISKKEILFTQGNLYDAMRASISIPNVFTPVKTEDSILVDGGVINNIPINHAKRIDNDLLIAVNVNAQIPLTKNEKENLEEHGGQESFYQSVITKFRKRLSDFFSGTEDSDLSYFDIMSKSFELMMNEKVKTTLSNYPPDILIEVSRESCNIYDFYKGDQLIEMGRKATIESIKNYKDQS